ncbi:XRE family transcriptional regulator [Pseudomonas sp. NPDC089996]|uniref:XRE family transcriptional regulator n=1 Tax=Pseudomonas sp. NPDC089996 TaxID=3364474 RepID=UPI0037F563CB
MFFEHGLSKDSQQRMNLQSLGNKLLRYRDQHLQTIEEVAAATDIDPIRLTRIEQGALEPTGDEVLILADYYRCDFTFLISNATVAPFEETETLYRAHGRSLTKEDRSAIQEFLYLCETEQYLTEQLYGVPQQFDFRPAGRIYKRHAEEAAKAFRQKMGHSDREVPRNIYAEFRSVGVHVFRRRLSSSKISGLFILHPTAGKCVLINHSEDIYRQRFSAAHEMAHAIFDSSEGVNVSYVNEDDLRETRANRFASCYLLPPAVLKHLPSPALWDEADTHRWANEFRVSCNALGVALVTAGLVDKPTSARIRGYRVPREAKIDPELPETLTDQQRIRKSMLLSRGLSDHYVSLCLEAYSRQIISLGRLSEALLCGHGELSSMASLYGRTIHGY